MRNTPPLLPIEAYRRVLRLARANGTSVLFGGGLFALLLASGGDRVGTLVSLLVAGSGAMELHGANLLARAGSGGIRWLFASQAFLMIVMVGYIAFAMRHLGASTIADAVPTAELQALNLTKNQLCAMFYFTCALATVLYQGGMMIYYAVRRRAVLAALGAE